MKIWEAKIFFPSYRSKDAWKFLLEIPAYMLQRNYLCPEVSYPESASQIGFVWNDYDSYDETKHLKIVIKSDFW